MYGVHIVKVRIITKISALHLWNTYLLEHLILWVKEREFGVKFEKWDDIGQRTIICHRNTKVLLETYTGIYVG